MKPRQKGLTKAIDADQLMDCIKKYTNAVVISHNRESTERLFEAVRYYISSMNPQPFTSIDNKSTIKFPKRGSSYFIGTAGQKAFGRGDTIHRAHLSEAAFYQDFRKILAGIAEAAEYGQIDIETTANGRNEFYEEWEKAKAGKSPYTNIFIPWFIDREYSTDGMTEGEIMGLSRSVQDMFEVTDTDFIGDITEEERRLVRRVKEEYNIALTVGQLKWRRYKIWDKGDIFFQEYPEDDVTCFLQAGRPVFRHIVTDPTIKVPLDRFDTWVGHEERKAQLRNTLLFAGVDGAEGVDDGDNHCLSIIDPGKGDNKAGVIYEYVSNDPIEVFWNNVEKIMKRMGLKIHLGIEKNGIGGAHVLEARRRGIPHTAWHTGTNRPVMISDLETAYRLEDLIEGYPEAAQEARDMFYDSTNKAVHPKTGHDDRVFGRAIALGMMRIPRPRITVL